jgi:hypothetical protein
LESYQIEAFKRADKGAMWLSGTSRHFGALMAGLAAGSTGRE